MATHSESSTVSTQPRKRISREDDDEEFFVEDRRAGQQPRKRATTRNVPPTPLLAPTSLSSVANNISNSPLSSDMWDMATVALAAMKAGGSSSSSSSSVSSSSSTAVAGSKKRTQRKSLEASPSTFSAAGASTPVLRIRDGDEERVCTEEEELELAATFLLGANALLMGQHFPAPTRQFSLTPAVLEIGLSPSASSASGSPSAGESSSSAIMSAARGAGALASRGNGKPTSFAAANRDLAHLPLSERRRCLEQRRRQRMNESIAEMKALLPASYQPTALDKASTLQEALAYLTDLTEENERLLREEAMLEKEYRNTIESIGLSVLAVAAL